MERKKLTQLAVDQLKPQEERYTIWDGGLPGFGLRVSPRGKKSWIAAYRVRRKFVIETLGSMALYPKVDEARDMARESMRKARQGINPVDERRAANAAEEEAEKGVTTFKAVLQKYLRQRVAIVQNDSTGAETARIFANDITPHWGKRDIGQITSADVRRLLDRISERSPIVAQIALSRLRTFFRWAVKQEFVEKDPTAPVDRLVRKVERERVLSDEEIVKFWSACEEIGWPYEGVFKLLLLTGQRRDEVAEMVQAELDIGKGLWIIPGARTKNGKLHEVHLSSLALEILDAQPIINNSELVFTSNGKPLSGWSAAKKQLDKLMGECPAWRIHDLRRTAASGMAGIGIAPHVVDKILNHTSGTISGVAAVYNRHQYRDDRISALDAWANYITGLMQPGGADNVVRLTARESA